MKRAKYMFIPAVVTLLVFVVSLFPEANVTRKASAAPRAAVITKYLMIPAAAFIGKHDGIDYLNHGYQITTPTGGGEFYSPVYLPPGARFRLIKLYAKDGNTNEDVCAFLYETYPIIGTQTETGQSVCTTGSGGIQQPMKYLSHYVKWYNGYYIVLWIPAGADLSAYAVMIKYNVRQ
jgi:hypothetical protein